MMEYASTEEKQIMSRIIIPFAENMNGSFYITFDLADDNFYLLRIESRHLRTRNALFHRVYGESINQTYSKHHRYFLQSKEFTGLTGFNNHCRSSAARYQRRWISTKGSKIDPNSNSRCFATRIISPYQHSLHHHHR